MKIDTSQLDPAVLLALVFACAPSRLGGVVIKSSASLERDEWIKGLRGMLPEQTPFKKVPVGVSDDRLLGGIDYSATLSSSTPVYASGLLSECHQGVAVLAMAERLDERMLGIICQALDSGHINVQREGLSKRVPAAFSILALDEGVDDEMIHGALSDRLALMLSSDQLCNSPLDFAGLSKYVSSAKKQLETVTLGQEGVEVLCQTALALGDLSHRGTLFACQVAKILAAINGNRTVTEGELELASALVLAQRARQLPVQDEQPEESPPQNPQTDSPDDSNQSNAQQQLEDVVLEAATAAIPKGLLQHLGETAGTRISRGGRGIGAVEKNPRSGRPIGSRPMNGQDGRIHLLATIKAAIPWQKVRKRDQPLAAPVAIRKEDLQISRLKKRSETTTVFAVDASGSQAAQRLAEVKGAVELFLNECYVRRDQVCLIGFRGETAEVLLPPTRALARVKRALAAMPGGGGTPLAQGIDATRDICQSIARQGRTPTAVFLTDGRGNVSREGDKDKTQGQEHAAQAAALFRSTGVKSIVLDTSRRPSKHARQLAKELGAYYEPLPYANAENISSVVRQRLSA